MDTIKDEVLKIPRFSVLTPFPDNQRLISICGVFPSHENLDHEYEHFERLLWLLVSLDQKEKGKPITLVIDSPGGDVFALEMLLDYIKLISSPIYTVARCAGSAAAILFVSGAREHRYVFEYSKIILHNIVWSHVCLNARWPFKGKDPLENHIIMD